MKIKTRFSPSPTGYLHLGSVRTALYSWLFARQNKGVFVLRIEDTDCERSNALAIKEIMDGMKWLKLDWDEGPYFQTERFDRYNEVIDKMLATGTAYKCYCSKERLAKLRKNQIASGQKPRYDNLCRYATKKKRIAASEQYVVRFANPQYGVVIFDDQIRGQIKFRNQELDDLIIRRVNGFPTYNFCVVIDDWDMKITHVIRGEDHINNTPRQINILKALGAPVPIYAHISMINDCNGKKLSKRHGALNIMQYRDDGYLPEAMLNYLVRLGWSSGNQEIFSSKEMIALFSLKEVRKSSSRFNINKLLWLNHYYINNMPPEHIASYLQWNIKQANINTSIGPKLVDIVKLFRERCKTLKEMAENCRYFYEEFDNFDVVASKKYLQPEAFQALKIICNKFTTINEWTTESIHHAIQATANELKVELSKICMPLRIAVTGISQSPTLDKTIYIIGKIRSIARIKKALSFIFGEKKKTKNNLAL